SVHPGAVGFLLGLARLALGVALGLLAGAFLFFGLLLACVVRSTSAQQGRSDDCGGNTHVKVLSSRRCRRAHIRAPSESRPGPCPHGNATRSVTRRALPLRPLPPAAPWLL